MKTRNPAISSYRSKAISTGKEETIFSLVWVIAFSIMSSSLGKVKVFPVTLTRQSKPNFNVSFA